MVTLKGDLVGVEMRSDERYAICILTDKTGGKVFVDESTARKLACEFLFQPIVIVAEAAISNDERWFFDVELHLVSYNGIKVDKPKPVEENDWK